MDYVWSVEPPKSTPGRIKNSDNGGCKSRASPKPSEPPKSILDIYTISLLAWFTSCSGYSTDIWYLLVETRDAHHVDVNPSANCAALYSRTFAQWNLVIPFVRCKYSRPGFFFSDCDILFAQAPVAYCRLSTIQRQRRAADMAYPAHLE